MIKSGYKSTSSKPTILKAYDSAEMLPSLSLDENDLPEIKKWKVGGKYQILLTVTQVSLSKDPMDSNEMRARFNITKAQAYDEKAEDSAESKGA